MGCPQQHSISNRISIGVGPEPSKQAAEDAFAQLAESVASQQAVLDARCPDPECWKHFIESVTVDRKQPLFQEIAGSHFASGWIWWTANLRCDCVGGPQVKDFVDEFVGASMEHASEQWTVGGGATGAS